VPCNSVVNLVKLKLLFELLLYHFIVSNAKKNTGVNVMEVYTMNEKIREQSCCDSSELEAVNSLF
jgi:hypothetical protein